MASEYHPPKYNWIKAGNIIIPACYGIHKKIESEKDPFISIIPYSEIFNKPMPMEEIEKRLAQYDLHQVLLFFSKICLLLYNDGIHNSDLQQHLAKDHFSNDAFSKIMKIENSLLRRGKSIRPIFVPQQILVLMKKVILQKLHGSKKVDDKNIREISTLTLAINDHLQMVKFKGEELSELQRDQQTFESLICNFWFNTDERFKYLLTRYNILFLDLCQSEFFETQFPFAKYFKEATDGLDLTAYFSLGFAILAKFVKASRVRPSVSRPSLNEGYFLLNAETDFQSTEVGFEEFEKILQEFSAELDYFEVQYNERRENADLDPDYDFFPFIRKPLIKLKDKFFILSSRRFLEEKITTGVYWLIHDYVKHNLPNNKWGDFKRVFGDVFETYICSIFKRMFPSEGPFLIRQFFTEIGKRGKRGQAFNCSILRKYNIHNYSGIPCLKATNIKSHNTENPRIQQHKKQSFRNGKFEQLNACPHRTNRQ